jgi:hypothetical protein
LEKRPGFKERIAYLTKQAEERIAEKRARIEERLWAIHEANIQDLFETYEQPKATKDGKIETDQNGQMRVERKERPRLISELSPDIAPPHSITSSARAMSFTNGCIFDLHQCRGSQT